MLKDMPDFSLLPEIDLKPRVYFRKMGGEYTEITNVQSFERSDFEDEDDKVTFVMSGEQGGTVKDLLNASDKYVEVRMEFSLGATMVMTFSGLVESFTGDTITFAMSSPIVTEVMDDSVTLH